MRILIVEDDINSGQALKALLEMDSHEVVHAASFTVALELISSCKFDVALIDVQLPDGNGADLVARLRHRAARVWLATGSSKLDLSAEQPVFENPAELARACGADGCLAKPIDYERLLEIISAS